MLLKQIIAKTDYIVEQDVTKTNDLANNNFRYIEQDVTKTNNSKIQLYRGTGCY